MSARNRVFLGILAIYVLSVGLLLYGTIKDLDVRYRESAEESLVETAYLLASFLENGDLLREPNSLQKAFDGLYGKRFKAKIYGLAKTQVELRVYVTDAQGMVLFDSLGKSEGQDFSRWRDVSLTLRKQYGARTTLDTPGDWSSAVMYVGAPVLRDGAVVGVVSVGKPVQSFNGFVQTARHQLVVAGVGAMIAFVLLALIVSVWLVRPFALIADYVRYVRSQRKLSVLGMLRRAVGTLGQAYDEMRDALAGRHYASEYVQTLTHEIKSPLSAIRGAAELLQEPMPDAEREKFLANISRETQRIQDLVDRLLELSALETRRTLENPELVDIARVIAEVVQAAEAKAQRLGVEVIVEAKDDVRVRGDAFLLHRAIANLLDNALDFSPRNGTVEISAASEGKTVKIVVRDHGTGIPDYAIDRVFDKFYSLARPGTNRKGTGLGLAFVREIAQLHGGRVWVGNAEGGGGEAVVEMRRQR